MDKPELLKKLKALQDSINDYLDNVDMAEADCDKQKPSKSKEKEA